MDDISFTIPVPPVTKKNSPQILTNPRTGKTFPAPSAAYKRYENDARWFMPHLDAPIGVPVNVKAVFYMDSRRRCDLVNLEQCLLDVLHYYGVIEDDNYKIVASMDGSRVRYDNENARTEVTISEYTQ